jgi:hypothetical protein
MITNEQPQQDNHLHRKNDENEIAREKIQQTFL